MAQVVVLSSQVARGFVGLSAALPVLQALGHEAVALPTVVLSNHRGHPRTAGLTFPVERLREMIDAVDAQGWLAGIDAVLTGYLPTAGHAGLAAELVSRIRDRRPGALYVLDPVLGDDPKGLYVEASVAEAVRERLLPLASIATPNRFELAWLSGLPITDVRSALEAARALPAPETLATSIPLPSSGLGTLLASKGEAMMCRSPRADNVPHGTGDVLTALFAGLLLKASSRRQSLARATAAVAALVKASAGLDELALVGPRAAWLDAAPLPVESL